MAQAKVISFMVSSDVIIFIFHNSIPFFIILTTDLINISNALFKLLQLLPRKKLYTIK